MKVPHPHQSLVLINKTIHKNSTCIDKNFQKFFKHKEIFYISYMEEWEKLLIVLLFDDIEYLL
jgi:hypothetical protein